MKRYLSSILIVGVILISYAIGIIAGMKTERNTIQETASYHEKVTKRCLLAKAMLYKDLGDRIAAGDSDISTGKAFLEVLEAICPGPSPDGVEEYSFNKRTSM